MGNIDTSRVIQVRRNAYGRATMNPGSHGWPFVAVLNTRAHGVDRFNRLWKGISRHRIPAGQAMVLSSSLATASSG